MQDVVKYSQENLSFLVVNYIKDKILIGELKAGDRIQESKITDELKISRIPVREAMHDLEKEGLITVAPRKGAYIKEFAIKDIEEIYDIRQLLEIDVIRLIIENDLFKEDDIDNLTDIVNEMVEVAVSEENTNKKCRILNMLDIKFHSYIWELSDSKRRSKILKDLFFQLRMAMLYDTKLTDNLSDTAGEHYAIIKGLKERDLEACKKHLRDHIITYRN